jgi:uncharacterized protein DUF6970
MNAYRYALPLFLLLAAACSSDDDDEPSVTGGTGGAGGSDTTQGTGGAGAGGTAGAGQGGGGAGGAGGAGDVCGTPEAELARAPQAVKAIVDERKTFEQPSPQPVVRYNYDGVAVNGVSTVVYYVPPPPNTSDIPSEVYTQDGTLLCQPDGGFVGGGDMKCPDFADKRTNPGSSATPCVVWEDTRKPK